jgi:acetyl-CoA acetyltransferase family protein
MTPAYLVGGVRTPVGRYGGALAGVRPDDLASLVVGEVLRRTALPADRVDDVILGSANQAGEDNRNVARMAVLLAGLPDTVPGYTVNRLCASGLQAVVSAAQAVRSGDAAAIVAGGVESMSRSPWVMAKPGTPWARPGEVADTALGWRLVNPRMAEVDGGAATQSLGVCTENLARDLGITRADADAFAERSQQRAEAAAVVAAGDLVAVPTATGVVDLDETIRAGTTAAGLAALRPAFAHDGICTAGNSSPLSDGASAIVVAGDEAVRDHGLVPRARLVSVAAAGVAPSRFGLGPVPAIRDALARAGRTLDEMDVIEINEAFAAQVLACTRELGLADDRVNPAGGAIALGHPLGSSGSRILVTMLGHLERTGGRWGLAALCVGVGQGLAVVVERV